MRESWETSAASLRLLAKYARCSRAELPSWEAAFSALTLEYPRLQASGLIAAEPAKLETALRAHLMLLVRTFVEDRYLDGQIVLEPDERLLLERLEYDGSGLLTTLAGARAARAVHEARGKFIAAQEATLAHGSHLRAPFELSRIASGRAAPGFVATGVLLESQGASDVVVRGAWKAYESLVVGLQWVDDLEDWRADLHFGNANLVLSALGRRGFNAYSHSPSTGRTAQVSAALLTSGVFSFAHERALKWIETSAQRQRQLECIELAEKLDALIERMNSRRAALESALGEDVLESMLSAIKSRQPTGEGDAVSPSADATSAATSAS